MKILHVITSLRTGGAEHLMVDLLPELKKMGNEMELLVFDGTRTPFYEQAEAMGIKIHSLAIGESVYSPKHIFRLCRFIRHYDVIHTHNTACQLFVPIAKCLTFSGAKLVTTEHNANNRRRGKWYLKMADKWMYSRYEKIICIADQTKQNLEAHIGKKKKIITIYNGVNTANFLKPINEITNRQNFIITMIAAFREQKDQDTLIRAMAELPDNYTLQIVGDGPRRPILEKLAEGKNVEFLGIRTDIPDILSSTDIVVLSSHWEGLSLSSIEGMASGRPFIASDVDGLHEMVNGAGVLFPDGDHIALASAIRSLCENPEKYKAVAARCQARAKDYDISKMAAGYNAVYQEITNE